MENKDLINVLEGKIETRILPNKNYPYVPASAVRSRLNEAFGGRWNTHILSTEVIDEETILTLLELTCFVGEDKIVKEGFGSAPIHKYSSGINKGKPVNLGDAYGNSVMDAIKSCSKQMGIGNREMDVKKDPKTGKYVPAGNTEPFVPNNVIPITQTDPAAEEKINELKKKLEANKTKDTVAEPKPAFKEPVIEKEDDVPMPESSPVKEPENVPEQNAPALTKEEESKAKIIELRKKLEANKKSVSTSMKTEPEPESNIKPETESKPEEEADLDYGFDYGGVGNSNEGAPKNTQKLVILNLAKMQKLTPEEYINKALGKTKTIDELTAEEAGQVVRAGLSKFE